MQDIPNRIYTESIESLIRIKARALQDTFKKIKPFVKRQKRWDTIGKIWKWIAGTPDADDLHVINSTMNSLITENNKQVIINQGFNERLQQITDVANKVISIENERYESYHAEIRQLTLLSNINMMQDKLEVIEDAILLAKHGIPSSKLLSLEDLNSIAQFLEKNNIEYTTPEELLRQSTAQVAVNQTHILYMLKFPMLSSKIYEYDYIDSIIQHDTRIIVNQNFILQNQTHVFTMTEKCEEQENVYICPQIGIQKPTSCIYQIVKREDSQCSYEKIYSRGFIKRIKANTILINDAIAEIASNCSKLNQVLNGSYVIQFENCNVIINGEIYSNNEVIIHGKPFQSTAGINVEIGEIKHKPPFELIQTLTMQHREKLQKINLQNDSLSWKINVAFGGTFTLIGVCAILTCLFFNFKKTTIKMTQAKQPETFVPNSFHAASRL